jgi:hypothetical protein
MERNEIIFFAILIIAYVLCALMLDMPPFIHYIFIAIIAIVLVIAVLLRYQQKFENRQIGKVFNIIALISLILYVITSISETYFKKTLIIDSTIFIIPLFGALVVGWFFRKEK